MSSFSADWLALREPADRRARNRDLLAALAGAFGEKPEIGIIDLGCGTGANLRACAPALPPRQRWRLVDHDPALLATARDRLSAWADHCTSDGHDLHLTRESRAITVSFACADLAADIEAALGPQADLVTASALFDLVSAEWIDGFVGAVARRRAVFYGALTYDGVERWTPPHPADAALRDAFHAHLGRDKGFGPSAGCQAGAMLARAFETFGYAVRAAASPWRLDSGDARLIRALATGVAQAVRETGQVEEDAVAAWLDARLNGAACTIGHTDLLALPAG
jgi:SAM-dependent methyltransferase